jgi:hypothetical protein
MNQRGENPLPDEPAPAELEMILDETNIAEKGRPLARTPEEGIADMQGRLEFLTTQIQKVKDRVKLKKSDEKFQVFAGPVLDQLTRDLTEAQSRLREYQTQLDGRN